MHRRYVLWMRGNKQLTKFLQQNRFIYMEITDLITMSTEQAVLAVLQDGLPGQRAHLGQRLNTIFVL
jgi:hypothetical protein